jgi:4'-phosphopantetheinyl transferase EntD
MQDHRNLRRSLAIETLFPAGVVAAETREPGEVASLFPAEAASIARAVPKRAQEFAAGRGCARLALAEFGIAAVPIEMASDRQPIWPKDCVGSITHTEGFCAAVVAQRTRVAALGIDTEIVGHVTAELWPSICTASDRAWLDALPAPQRDAAVTLIFAAKEAFYKCQYPLTREWLDFHDLSVSPRAWNLKSGEFAVTPTRPIAVQTAAGSDFVGRYLFHERYVSTGVALSAAPAPAAAPAPTAGQ